MKARSVLARWLLYTLVLALLPCAANAQAAGNRDLHRYLGIPFDTGTATDVSDILLEKKGATFVVSPKVLSGTVETLTDFGYDWRLQIDFHGKYKGIGRILLSSAQPAHVPGDAFWDRLRSDLLEYIDVETQLTALYGQPDCRFFYTDNRQYNVPASARLMFPDGQWDVDQMVAVCKKDLVLRSFTLWGNVALSTWSDSRKGSKMENRTRVMLYYYDKPNDVDPDSILDYPPSAASGVGKSS